MDIKRMISSNQKMLELGKVDRVETLIDQVDNVTYYYETKEEKHYMGFEVDLVSINANGFRSEGDVKVFQVRIEIRKFEFNLEAVKYRDPI